MLKFLLQPLVSALLACLIYGVWAAYVNLTFGPDVALKAALIQGGFAFFATLSLGLLAKIIYVRCGANRIAVVISFSLCFGVMFIVPFSLHYVLGTPNIIQSMIPGLIWGSGYIGLLIRTLHKEATS